MKNIGSYVTFIYLLISVSGQECTDTVAVGSLDYSTNNLPAPVDRTYILTGYTIPCNGTVVAWEYCYQISSAERVIFYPGIWRITRTNDVDFYTLLQANEVTFDSRGTPPNVFLCSIFNVSDTEQFIAPAGSVVGLYTLSAQLLRTNTDDSITTYKFERNQNNVNSTGTDVNYNIAIRLHLLTSTSGTTTVTPTTSIVSTSDTTTITPAASTVSTSNTNMVTITTATVSNSSGSTVIQTTSPAATITPSDVPMLNNSSSSSDNIIILIGGVVGGVVVGVILLIIIVVLCIVCMRRRHRKENTGVIDEHNSLVEHVYDTIDSCVPATPHDVPRKTSEDIRNFVQQNKQSYGEENKRNTINPPTYEVSTGESATSGIRAHQSLSDDGTTKESNGAEPNGGYGVVNQYKSDNPNL